MQRISFKKFIPGIAWFFIVLILMCLRGSDMPEVGWLDKIYFDKWAHAGVFFLLTFLFCLPFYNSSFKNSERIRYFMKIAIAVGLWGLTTEFIQEYFIAGREFDLLDWAADSFGALIAFWVCTRKLLPITNRNGDE